MMMMMMMMKTNTIMNTLLIIRYYYIVWINYIQLYTSIMLATPMLTMDDGSQDWLGFPFSSEWNAGLWAKVLPLYDQSLWECQNLGNAVTHIPQKLGETIQRIPYQPNGISVRPYSSKSCKSDRPRFANYQQTMVVPWSTGDFCRPFGRCSAYVKNNSVSCAPRSPPINSLGVSLSPFGRYDLSVSMYSTILYHE